MKNKAGVLNIWLILIAAVILFGAIFAYTQIGGDISEYEMSEGDRTITLKAPPPISGSDSASSLDSELTETDFSAVDSELAEVESNL